MRKIAAVHQVLAARLATGTYMHPQGRDDFSDGGGVTTRRRVAHSMADAVYAGFTVAPFELQLRSRM